MQGCPSLMPLGPCTSEKQTTYEDATRACSEASSVQLDVILVINSPQSEVWLDSCAAILAYTEGLRKMPHPMAAPPLLANKK